MDIKQFDKKYSNKGGIRELMHMRAELMPLRVIASRFEVSRERVRQWMIEMFGEKYDPRADRRKKKEEAIESGFKELEENNTII